MPFSPLRPLLLIFLLLSLFIPSTELARKRSKSALAVASPSGPQRHSRQPSRPGRASVVHPPGVRPPKGVAGTLNKAKLKDFMRIGREILRRHRLLRTKARH